MLVGTVGWESVGFFKVKENAEKNLNAVCKFKILNLQRDVMTNFWLQALESQYMMLHWAKSYLKLSKSWQQERGYAKDTCKLIT